MTLRSTSSCLRSSALKVTAAALAHPSTRRVWGLPSPVPPHSHFQVLFLLVAILSRCDGPTMYLWFSFFQWIMKVQFFSWVYQEFALIKNRLFGYFADLFIRLHLCLVLIWGPLYILKIYSFADDWVGKDFSSIL